MSIYAFYITNHGFGHASRNVPIIKELLDRDADNRIIVKSDNERIGFLKRNLMEYQDRIVFDNGINDIGLIMQSGMMEPDLDATEKALAKDVVLWDEYILKEAMFLKENVVDIVVADIIAWSLLAAKRAGVPSVLIGNFDWLQNYESMEDKELLKNYVRCYHEATMTLWYTPHDPVIDSHVQQSRYVSMVARAVNVENVNEIKSAHKRPIVFVSMGASAQYDVPIDVSALPYDFLCTRGIQLEGENVFILPKDMINTPDYIAASSYVIAKGGWSTLAEIMLQRKKCALVMRTGVPEDEYNQEYLTKRQQCVAIKGDDLKDMQSVIYKIDQLVPNCYEEYYDSVSEICDIFEEVKNDTI